VVSLMQPYPVNLKAMTNEFCAVEKLVSFGHFLAIMNMFACKQVINSKREFSGFFQKRTGNVSPSKREFPVALNGICSQSHYLDRTPIQFQTIC